MTREAEVLAKVRRSDLIWGGLNAHTADPADYLKDSVPSAGRREGAPPDPDALLAGARARSARTRPKDRARVALRRLSDWTRCPELVSRRLGLHRPPARVRGRRPRRALPEGLRRLTTCGARESRRARGGKRRARRGRNTSRRARPSRSGRSARSVRGRPRCRRRRRRDQSHTRARRDGSRSAARTASAPRLATPAVACPLGNDADAGSD